MSHEILPLAALLAFFQMALTVILLSVDLKETKKEPSAGGREHAYRKLEQPWREYAEKLEKSLEELEANAKHPLLLGENSAFDAAIAARTEVSMLEEEMLQFQARLHQSADHVSTRGFKNEVEKRILTVEKLNLEIKELLKERANLAADVINDFQQQESLKSAQRTEQALGMIRTERSELRKALKVPKM